MGTAVSLFRRANGRAIASTLLASTLLLTACGDGGDPEEALTDPPAESTEEPGTESEETTEPEVEDAPSIDANLRDSCVEEYDPEVDYFPDRIAFDEAAGVSVEYTNHTKLVSIDVPFSEEGAPPFTALLVQCGTPAPGDMQADVVVEIPTMRVITMTTVNLPHFVALDALNTLAGVGTDGFVTSPEVVELIVSDGLMGFADPMGVPDRERILAEQPDLLIVDAFGATLLDDVQGYVAADVPTVINADFNESSPLGRAEWVKFTSLFVNAEEAANRVYDEIVASYAETAAKVADVTERPTVLLEMPFQGTWYAPRGGSFVGQLVADAGGQYVFADEEGTGSVAYDFETVLAEAKDADLWLNAGSVNGTLDDIAAMDERFGEFAAFQNGDVWASDLGANAQGGRPIFEEAVLRPDLQLADLAAIFHPELFPVHEFNYYGRVPAAVG